MAKHIPAFVEIIVKDPDKKYFLNDLKKYFPKAIIYDSGVENDRNLYLIKFSAKSHVKRSAIILGNKKLDLRKERSHIYWKEMFFSYWVDDNTGERIKVSASFYYTRTNAAGAL